MKKSPSGITLIELIISITLITVLFGAAVLVYSTVTRAVTYSRKRIVANNLAQEKIESLKNLSYSQLRATSDNNYLTYGYDNQFYLPETGLYVGDVSFERRVLVQRVREGTNGNTTEVSAMGGETGIKKITVSVLWNDAAQKKSISISSLRDDPNRKPLDSTIYGVISDTALAPLGDVHVSVVYNPSLEATTDAAGNYSIKVESGTYKIEASNRGYFTQPSDDISAYGSIRRDLTLTRMGTGKITGYVFKNDHLIISKVVASTDTSESSNLEWVELYNPTTYQWTVSGADIVYNKSASATPLATMAPIFNNFNIPAYGYYLIANTPTITMNGYVVNADAYYDHDLIDDTDASVSILHSGTGMDKVGWGASAAINYEGTRIGDHLRDGQTFIRYSAPALVYSQNLGNAFDSNNNILDFQTNIFISASANYLPRNSSLTIHPVSGTPVTKIDVSCNDGLSVSTETISVTNAQGQILSYFEITNVATGTWNVMISSNNGLYTEISNVTLVNDGDIVGIPNNVTDPPWPANNLNYVIMSSITAKGTIMGRIYLSYNASLLGIGPIKVSGGGESAYSSSHPFISALRGYYKLFVEPGTYVVTANPDNTNRNYTSSSISVTISAGAVSSYNHITIYEGGSLTGRVRTDGGDNLKYVTVVSSTAATSNEFDALTGDDGIFTIKNLAVGTYTTRLVLDREQASAPKSKDFDVVKGQTLFIGTFTVTGAMAKFKGTVNSGSNRIGTGVLIIASTGTITLNPPAFTNALRQSGAQYYSTMSRSDGTYELPVTGGTYNLYAWYSTRNGQTLTASKMTALNRSVNAGVTAIVDFFWP